MKKFQLLFSGILFLGGLAFLGFSFFASPHYFAKSQSGKNVGSSSSVVLMKMRLSAIEKAKKERKTTYQFVVAGPMPFSNMMPSTKEKK